MSQEIIYTSAPQGLRPGSFGFCTVATTPGMTSTLAERLEAISGYRHVYSPGDVKEHLNPVVYSHLIFRVAGKPQHILSRVANAGFDYSQRTNKLAHHVVLDASELVSAGPAWVLAQPGFSETTWSGAPRLLPHGRICPKGESELRICSAWQKATGDAGWAGVFAQQALRGGKTAYLIFPEGMDVLPLLQEALALLPAPRRWDVTFSTFFTRLPQGVDCAWRCVLANSTEAIAAVSKQEGLIIELGRTLGPAPDNDLVVAARTGKSTTPQPRAAAKPLQAPIASPIYADDEDFFNGLAEAADDGELKLAPPEFKGKSKGIAKPVVRGSGPPKLPPKASRGRRVGLIVGLIAFTVLLVAGVVGAMVFRDRLPFARNPAAELVKEAKPDDAIKAREKKDKPAEGKLAETADGSKKDFKPTENDKSAPGKIEADLPKKDKAEEQKPSELDDSPAKSGNPSSPAPGGGTADPPKGESGQIQLPQASVERALAAAGQVQETVNEGKGGLIAPPLPQLPKKGMAWKWPIEPVFPEEPAMKEGKPSVQSRQVFMKEDRLIDFKLVGVTGRKILIKGAGQGPPWIVNSEDTFKTKRDIAVISINENLAEIEWKIANPKQAAEDLQHLSACAIIATRENGDKRLVPFSFQQVAGVTFGLSGETKSEPFYLPPGIISELHIVGIEFDRENGEWQLDPPPATNLVTHKCSVTLKTNAFVESRFEFRQMDSASPKYCLCWDVLFGGHRVSFKQYERFKEVPELVKQEDDIDEKLATARERLAQKSQVQNPSVDELKASKDLTTRIGELSKSKEEIGVKYRDLGVSDSSTARFVRDKFPGTLCCFIVRRVQYETASGTAHIDIPLVRIGGDPQP